MNLTDLETDTQREGESDDDNHPGEDCEEPATDSNTILVMRVIRWNREEFEWRCVAPAPHNSLVCHAILGTTWQ